MKGNVIGYDPDTNTGAISGYDGQRYEFATQDWHSRSRPKHGDIVDFLPQDQRAAQIYPIEPEYVAPSLGQFLFSVRGRISRSQFWLKWSLPAIGIHVALGIGIVIGAASDNSGVAGTFLVLWLLFCLISLWPSTAVLVKRMHDRDKTGWLVLAYYVPLLLQIVMSPGEGERSTVATVLQLITGGVGIWFFVEFGCLRGTIGPNRYGPDPLGDTNSAG